MCGGASVAASRRAASARAAPTVNAVRPVLAVVGRHDKRRRRRRRDIEHAEFVLVAAIETAPRPGVSASASSTPASRRRPAARGRAASHSTTVRRARTRSKRPLPVRRRDQTPSSCSARRQCRRPTGARGGRDSPQRNSRTPVGRAIVAQLSRSRPRSERARTHWILRIHQRIPRKVVDVFALFALQRRLPDDGRRFDCCRRRRVAKKRRFAVVQSQEAVVAARQQTRAVGTPLDVLHEIVAHAARHSVAVRQQHSLFDSVCVCVCLNGVARSIFDRARKARLFDPSNGGRQIDFVSPLNHFIHLAEWAPREHDTNKQRRRTNTTAFTKFASSSCDVRRAQHQSTRQQADDTRAETQL